MPFGEREYEFLGCVYEMQDFELTTAEKMARLRAIVDAAFGRTSTA